VDPHPTSTAEAANRAATAIAVVRISVPWRAARGLVVLVIAIRPSA
jgi:hypothetical protein